MRPFRLVPILVGLAVGLPPVLPARLTQRDAEDALFELAVVALSDDRGGLPLRVDPRPLRPAPDLVTLHAFMPMPERVRLGSWEAPYAPVEQTIVEERRGVLQRLGIPEAEGLPSFYCPPSLMPYRTAEELAHATRGCPREAYRIAFLALPREGGVWWPRNRDARAKYTGRDVVSVRVIQRHYHPGGQLETSADLVFERTAASWTLLERVNLMIVE